jgi:hypothetical protein
MLASAGMVATSNRTQPIAAIPVKAGTLLRDAARMHIAQDHAP